MTRCIYRVGPYTLDAACVTLSLHGQPLDANWRCVRAFSLLLRAGGEVVAKEELRGPLLWPGTRVEESSLHRCISMLRRILAEDGVSDFVETVPRVGYRWTGPVDRVLDEPPAEAATDAPGPPPVPVDAGQLPASVLWQWGKRLRPCAGRQR